ncbi:TetR/AcrR family transcriptional regulator [Runella sp. MFBS21]|uniref:TetR/AcrR family transcriptional regulator n=1 Tax=Runella sp. MFBS21 TaxID=3034018 RepID=UPI0023F81F95|nr:TetR/AcrR family transcriptional regulator [Runella sp. MFBS21]MDF7820468.1 TetR/AcrR family transcriptional regulator [Runella sp. MFBS21]
MRTRDENKEIQVQQKAIELIVAHGLEGFSMQKLAKAAEVSPATLYIYYKDKEDLITSIGLIIGKKFSESVLKDFHADLPFAEGLRIQWRNRAQYAIENRLESEFYEQIRSSSFKEKIMENFVEDFKISMGMFVKNAIRRGELTPMPIEVFWSIAYAPLYNLIRFHHEGRSIGGQPFKISNDIIEQTLALTIKALTPS